MSKIKILWVGDATYLNSGYSNYGRELLSRLHKHPNFEIAELASYGNMCDPRVKNIPWKYYANAPEPFEEHQKTESFKVFKSRLTNTFGEWRFDKVLLDFRPDLVLSIRDYWMDEFINRSHLRPYFSWLHMPTADSYPQEDEWISTYIEADGILTYTDWSKDILDKQSGGKIKTLGSAPYGLDYDLFSPAKDKISHKESYGISGDSFIVGTVMRNFKRKLFPDLIHAFANAVDKLPKDLSSKLFLYLHTSYPDMTCWDLPKLILEAGIGTKTIVSYICKLCKKSSSMIFQDARTRCPHCNEVACVLPSVGLGYSTEQLVDVYRLFDLYVQYAITEGLGMPQIEAAACGVSIASVDYSAMADVVRRVEGYPIKVQRMFREFESHAYRAYPDNDHLTDIICKHIQLPDNYRTRKSEKTREFAKAYYNWNRVSQIWIDAINNVYKNKRKNWNDDIEIFESTNTLPPETVSNSDFIEYCYKNIFYKPSEIYTINGLNILRDLNFGAAITRKGVEPFSRKNIADRLKAKIDGKNLTEKVRCNLMQLVQDDFIRFANTRNIKS